MHLKDILTLFFGLSAASLIAACSTIAQVDYALAGAPDTYHEYQHVGQALTNKEIDHEHWR